MKKITVIILTMLVSLLICQNQGNAVLKWYPMAAGTWTHTGPDYAFGDNMNKTIGTTIGPDEVEYITSYVIECWGDINVVCFSRTGTHIGVGLFVPPEEGDTLNAIVSGFINE